MTQRGNVPLYEGTNEVEALTVLPKARLCEDSASQLTVHTALSWSRGAKGWVASEKRTVCMGLGAKIDLHPAHTLPIARC